MEIKKVISDKKEFLELLLLADEQESMIDRYLERGDMFVLYDNGLKACCVVTREGEGIYEIKNIATISFFQRQGYGKRLIQFLFDHYLKLFQLVLLLELGFLKLQFLYQSILS